MVINILLAAGILLYAGWVIRKKVRDFKKGKYCSCGCEDCSGRCGEFSVQNEKREL